MAAPVAVFIQSGLGQPIQRLDTLLATPLETGLRRDMELFMGNAIGDVLPLALGIAISPVPIIAAILMLFSPKAASTGLAFLAGWLLGIAVPVVVFTALAGGLSSSNSSSARPALGIVQLVLGLLLLFLAWRQWHSRPGVGDEAEMPKWMGAIDSMTAVKALALGFLLAGVNPKNLAMSISAGVSTGGAALSFWSSTVVIVIFTLVACCTVAIPVVGYLVSAESMRKPLDAMRAWLSHNNSTIMAVMLLIFGVVVLSKGIAQF